MAKIFTRFRQVEAAHEPDGRPEDSHADFKQDKPQVDQVGVVGEENWWQKTQGRHK